jgi:hypothetical protein
VVASGFSSGGRGDRLGFKSSTLNRRRTSSE